MDSRGARGLARSIALISTLLFLATAGDAAAATGSLAFLEQDVSGTTMDGARGVAVSPDGKSVYVAGQDSDSIVAYSRGAGGALTSIGCYRDTAVAGCTATEGLSSARFVAVSPDNKHVYVTGGDDETVVLFQRDLNTGALSSPTCYSGIGSPATCLGSVSVPLGGAEGIAVAPNGGQVYVAAQADNAVVALTRNTSNGSLSAGPSCFVQVAVSGCTTTTGLQAPREIAVSPDGGGVYVASATSDVVKGFQRNSGDGTLTSVGQFGGVSLPVGVAVSPDSKNVYAGAAEAGDANSPLVRTYTRNLGTSALTADGCVKDTGSPATGCTVAEGLAGVEGVAVSPDGLNVYAAGAGDNAIVALTRSSASGALTPLECHRDAGAGGGGCGSAQGLASAHGVAVSPDGLNVYVTGSNDDAVVTFQRQPAGPPVFEPPRPNPNCTNLVTLLVTCAEPNGPPGVCGARDSILPQCYLPTVLPQVCGPSNTLLVACVPPNNYVAACGGTGTVLPVCTLPPPQLPQVCGPSNTLLPACTGANNPIVVCGPPSRGLPACNLPPGAVEGSTSSAGTGIVDVTVGCPAANAIGSPPTCTVDAVVVDRRRALISSLRAYLNRWVPFAIERTLDSTGLSGQQWNDLLAGDSAALEARANNVIDSAFREADSGPAPFRFTAALAALSSAGAPPLRGSYPFEPFRRELATFLSLLEQKLKEYQRLLTQSTRGSSASGATAQASAASRLVKPLARKRVKIRAGKRKRVKVKLSKRAVKQLRKGVAKRKAVAVRLLVTYKSKPRPVVSMVDFPIRVVKPKANSKGKGKSKGKRGKPKSKRR